MPLYALSIPYIPTVVWMVAICFSKKNETEYSISSYPSIYIYIHEYLVLFFWLKHMATILTTVGITYRLGSVLFSDEPLYKLYLFEDNVHSISAVTWHTYIGILTPINTINGKAMYKVISSDGQPCICILYTSALVRYIVLKLVSFRRHRSHTSVKNAPQSILIKLYPVAVALLPVDHFPCNRQNPSVI